MVSVDLSESNPENFVVKTLFSNFVEDQFYESLRSIYFSKKKIYYVFYHHVLSSYSESMKAIYSSDFPIDKRSKLG